MLHDDDDNLQLLTNRSPIAGRSGQQQTPTATINGDGSIPLHRATSQPNPKSASSKKKKSLKDTFNSLLGRSNAPSGTAGEGGERIIHINNSELNDQQKFMHNRVFTAKYTGISFLPKFLYEEFSKYANLFFLFISGIQVNAFVHMKSPDIHLFS
jgi:phospholipid-transporting ATPase